MAEPQVSSRWPRQQDANGFYGNPRGPGGASVSPAWQARSIVTVTPPFRMAMGGVGVMRIPIHKKCADALKAALERIWTAAGHDQRVIEGWGLAVFSGSFCYRPTHGGVALSMHAYGAAVDFDAPRNSNGAANFAGIPEVRAAFAAEGAVWGGDWGGTQDGAPRRPDFMHWQFARP